MSNENVRAETPLEAVSRSLASVVERTAALVVSVNGRPRFPSSGLVWRPGIVVTAAHTIKRDDELTVTTPDGQVVSATLAGRDIGTDLAVLRFSESVAAIERTDAPDLRVGELAIVVGRGTDGSPASGLGVIGSLGGAWRTWRGGSLDRLIRLDVGVYYGFSGAPVIDATGNVIGIATTGLSRSSAIAIPSSTIDRVTTELVERGSVARGFLGVGMQPVALPPALLERLGLQGGAGVIVLGVEPDGPADRAGLLIGDVVVDLAGQRVEDTDDVQATLTGDRVGTELPVTVIRGGAIATLVATVGEWPRGRGR